MKRAIVLLFPLAAACSTPQNPELDFANHDKPSATRQAKGAPPPMDPNRKVHEQDCSQPPVLDRGNLRCI
jgi:hypothetical protein